MRDKTTKKIKTLPIILSCLRLALLLEKAGCVSEIKMKKQVFHFVFRSTCTTFGESRLRLNKKNKNFCFYFVLSSACTTFAA